jgi:hypothetical protein
MTGGWQSQLDRVHRWYDRVSKAEDPADKRDFLYPFFENAFHLKEGSSPVDATAEQRLAGGRGTELAWYSIAQAPLCGTSAPGAEAGDVRLFIIQALQSHGYRRD